jgi:hypothetical protein
MSGFVSVGYTPQTTDICFCRRHVDNVGPTGRQHSVKSAYFFANKIVSGNRIPNTIFYVYVGIGTIHFWYVPRLPCMQQHNLSRTQPRTMSDGDICSNDEKYGGFGAMMANSLHRQEERREECEQRAARSLSVFATKTADVAASRGPAGKIPPPVTLIDKSKTSNGKRVADDITLAVARAPAKKVAPSASAPDLAPTSIFLNNPQATAAVKANLVEIVWLQMSCRGRSCEEHELCGDEVLKEDVVVRLRTVQLVVDGKEEKAIEVV